MTEDRIEFPENADAGGETEIVNQTDNADVDGDMFTPVVSAEDSLLIQDTISFINHKEIIHEKNHFLYLDLLFSGRMLRHKGTKTG